MKYFINLIALLTFLVFAQTASAKAPSQEAADILFFSAIKPDLTEEKVTSILREKNISQADIEHMIQIQRCIRVECAKLNQTLSESISNLKQQDPSRLRALFLELGLPPEQVELMLKSLNSGVNMNVSCQRSSPLMRTTLVDQCILFGN